MITAGQGTAAILIGLVLVLASPPPKAAPADTADRVGIDIQISERTLFPGRRLNVALTLRIAEGWHVIANPPSLEFLIPTTAQAALEEGHVTLDTHYPTAGKEIDVGLELTIGVYENGVIIPSTLTLDRAPRGKTRGKIAIRLHAQACSDSGLCLRPATIRKDVRVRFSDTKK